MAAYPSSVEFREIQVVAIDMQPPLTIKLSLLAISAEAVKAFQEICRDIIRFRERRRSQPALTVGQQHDIDAERRARIDTLLNLVLHGDGKNGHITEKETERLYGHIAILQNAAVPLKRVVVKEE